MTESGPGPDALTELARREAEGLLTEAVEEARNLARADLVAQLRQAIVAQAVSAPAGPTTAAPAAIVPEAAVEPAVLLPESDEPEFCLYAYAISDRADLEFSALNGSGAAIRCVSAGGLTLVVAEKPLSDLTDLPTDEITEDGSLAQLARHHDEVVRAAAEQATVLPLRLGTVVTDEAAARALLDSRREHARQQLTELRGRREWGVQFTSAGTRRPDEPTQPDNPTGTEYLAARRLARDAADRQQRERSVLVDGLHERLAKVSAGAVRRNAAVGVLADFAYLVAVQDEAAFQAELDHMTQDLDAVGLAVRVTGPWPPYSFVRSEEG